MCGPTLEPSYPSTAVSSRSTLHQLQQTGDSACVHVPQQRLGFRPHTRVVMFTPSPMQQHLQRCLTIRCGANQLHRQRVSSTSISMASSGAGKWAIAIHGGAGVVSDSDPVAMEAARQGLKRALAAGKAIRGGACVRLWCCTVGSG